MHVTMNTLKWSSLWSVSLLLGVFGTGCQHAYYAPALPLAPTFEQRGDWMLSTGVGTQVQAQVGAEVKAGYAFSNHLFGAVEGGLAKGKQTNLNEGRGQYIGFAGGWYYPFRSQGGNNWLFTLPFAFQVAQTEHSYYSLTNFQSPTPYFSGTTQHRFRKSSFEPGVTYLGSRFHFHTSIRLGALRYFGLLDNLSAATTGWRESFPALYRVFPVMEPCFALTYGDKQWKVQLKWVYSFPNYSFNSLDRTVGIGVVLYPRGNKGPGTAQ